MDIYRRPNSPFWWISYSINGKRKRFSSKRTSRSEARAVALAAYKRDLDTAQLDEAGLSHMTIGDAVRRYIRGAGDGPYRRMREVLFERTHGETFDPEAAPSARLDPDRFTIDPTEDMATITQPVLAKLWDERLAEGYSINSINNEIKQLGATYSLSIKEWAVAVAPEVKFTQRKGFKKRRYLTKEEETALLAALDPQLRTDNRTPLHIRTAYQDQYDLVVFLLDTGVRISEAGGVPWTFVDLAADPPYVRIYRSKTDDDGVIVLTKRLTSILERRYASRARNQYIFQAYGPRPDVAGDPRKHRGHATRGIQKVIDAIGLNDDEALVKIHGKLTPHSLRDTYCTRLLNGGLSLLGAQMMLGHKTPSMTGKYAHLESSHVAIQAANILDNGGK